MGNPLPLNLAQECRKAEKIITEFVDPAHGGLDRVIPMHVLRRAQGFAIFTVARLGFLMSARAGSGVVVARLSDDSWSPPSALGLGGLGAGFNAGLDVTDFLIVLNSKQAVRSFMATGSLQLGGNLSVAVGPLGRAAEASGALNSSGQVAAMFSYSKSKGLYGGVSLEGTVLVDRSDANSKAYHRNITAKQILEGNVEMPNFAQPLISLLEKHTLTGEIRNGVDGYSRGSDWNGYGRGGAWGNQHSSYDSDYDTLDRELRRTNLSSSTKDSGRSEYDRRDSFSSYEHERSYETSPSRERDRHEFGADRQDLMSKRSYSTDYKKDDVDYEYDSRLGNSRPTIPGKQNSADMGSGTFARSGVQYRAKQSPTNAFGSRELDDGSLRGSSPQYTRKPASFPMKFQQSDSSADENYSRSPPPTSTYKKSESPLPKARDPFGDLIDFKGAINSNRSSTQRPPMQARKSGKSNGFDDLDRELQERGSMSTDEEHYDDFASNGIASRPSFGRVPSGQTTPSAAKGWRADYGLPAQDYAAAPQSQRPPMHQRTSSAQKLWNRMRGNSTSKGSARIESPSMVEARDIRQRARGLDRSDSQGLLNGKGDDYYTGFDHDDIDNLDDWTPGAQGRRLLRKTSPTATRTSPTATRRSSATPSGLVASSGSATPPPAAVVAAALARSNNATPRADSAAGRKSSSASPGPLDALRDASGGYNGDLLKTSRVELRVVALFDFAGQEQDDLSFARGDVIDILRKTASREDWWLGRCNGQVGNLPANFTKDV